jgi:hypothetical protein
VMDADPLPPWFFMVERTTFPSTHKQLVILIIKFYKGRWRILDLQVI